PGPLCYGRDGYLSVTDANVVTGRIDIDNFPHIFGKSAKEPLNIQASKKGFEDIAKKVGKSIEEVAEAFLDVANENMANAIKEITLKKGYDPKIHILCSFGGAGGQHAVAVARKLGIKKIFIHAQSGILSAYGIANADITSTKIKVIEKPLSEVDLEKEFNELKGDKKKLFLKYKNTNTAVEVEYKDGFLDEFREKYKREFGFLLDSEIVVESIKADFIKKSSFVKRSKISGKFKFKEKKIFINGKWQKAKVYTSYGVGRIKGPALILQDTSTVVLDEGSIAEINEYGDIEITLNEVDSNIAIKAAKLSLYSNRLTFIAKKMGDILKKTAMSVNVKEREDYSCAIFDKEGDLIVNAPHIPVHLGSMSEVVKSIIKKHKIKNATYITNAPYEGGSHLPDITVVTPYIEDGEVIFWVASRGHHADIGGSVPGSMPPFSKFLKEEGAVIESFEIVENGEFKEEKIREILKKAGARKIDENISDIKAQIAANMAGIEEVLKLDRDELLWFFREIKEVSKKKVKEFFKNLDEVKAEDYLDSGAVIKFSAYRDEKIVFDFSGSSFQLLSNQNAPYSVVRSAVLYAIRVMLNEDIPLNDGILEEIELVLPKNSILNPDKDLAVVGGNVTTSQRIVDVIFKAFKVAAASQGCMNNVIFGNEKFGYYETICGGAGAGDGFEGASAVHTHMTNTKITDVEVIERRYPVMIEEFSIRKNSGGDGKYKGGDGVKRVYKFLEDVEVSLLTERRSFAPYGLNGGCDGKKGENLLKSQGKIYNLTGKINFKAKKGDKLIIKTPGGGGWG
ncbi:MAG: 5-oxoprolinase, partial [Epsilonproteobacteria bacterium]|nr:5-oxoprolinase [Campylobacterota bacterium]